MSLARQQCRHWQEPRYRGVAFCRSENVVGSRLVNAEICRLCPFYEAPAFEDGDAIHPAMSIELLAALIEQPPRVWPSGWEDWEVTADAHYLASQRFLHRLQEYPDGVYQGQGIVIAGGGRAFFPSLYVTVRALRAVGCKLPIEVWYLGREDEMSAQYLELLTPYGVVGVDADAVRQEHPCRILNGWELKVFALLHSSFEEALLLDADCYPAREPGVLFEDSAYGDTGAIFWPDFAQSELRNWKVFRVEPTGRASIESGQVVINKRKCWRPLQLAWWYNDHSDWTYLHAYGDKHTFEIAWARLEFPYQRFSERVKWARHSFVHPGSDGLPLFIHRCRDKFRFGPADYLGGQNFAENSFHRDLPLEKECFTWLDELRQLLEHQDAEERGSQTPGERGPSPSPSSNGHSRQTPSGLELVEILGEYAVFSPNGDFSQTARFTCLWSAPFALGCYPDGFVMHALHSLAQEYKCYLVACQSDQAKELSKEQIVEVDRCYPGFLIPSLAGKIGQPLPERCFLVPCGDALAELGLAGIMAKSRLNAGFYEDKEDVLFWRGGCSGSGLRREVVLKLEGAPECDVKLITRWEDNPSFRNTPERCFGNEVSLQHHLRYKRLLLIDGNSVGGASAWILASRTAVIHVGEWEPLWWPYALPGVHYLSVGTDLARLPEAIERAKEDGLHMAEAACRFILDLYTPHFFRGFLRNALSAALRCRS